MCFLRRGVVSTSPNPQAGGPPLVSCPRLLIQFIHSYPPYRRPFLHPQPEDAPCRRDRDPHSWGQQILQKYKVVSDEFDTFIFEINLIPLFSKSIWYIYIRNQFDTFIFETNPVQTFCTCRAKEFQVLKQNCAEFIQETSNMKSTIWKSVFGKCNCESQPV